MLQTILQNILQSTLQQGLQRTLQRAIEKMAEKNAGLAAEKEGKERSGEFRNYLVSGYQLAYTIKYISIPMSVFLLFCAIGSAIVGESVISVYFLLMILLFIFCVVYTKKKMLMAIYWEDGLVFVNQKGETMAQLSSYEIKQAEVNKTRIVFRSDNKKYVINRNELGNAKKIKEILAYYGVKDK